MSVVIETTIGDITVDLFTEERPVACLNFIKLCKLKYYNFNLFHTVEQGFIAQTGDPSGTGDGGCSVWGVVEGTHKRFFEAESLPKIHHSSAGLLSLVSAGKNLVGSQFFFTLADSLTSLDGIHCVIGEVVEGHETLRLLNEAIVDEKFRPFQDIRITHTVILDDPFADPRGFQVPSRSPSPSADRLKNGRIAADEDIDDTDGMSMQEIQEMLADREAKARATILEIVGDLPDADMAPPENVLFVCKLNPVTTDDDLEIIFSRFGKVKQCEVIRDKKSGESLQYAFVEFEEQSSCEAAYFKMDNVLIDDRRIHVDFSQSVARVKWRGKGRGVDGDGGRLDFNNLREPATGRRPERREEQRGQHQRNGRDRSDNRGRMTSEERRKAREERHREQEEASKKGRPRSRSLSPRRDDRRRYEDNRRQPERFNDRRHNYRANDRRRNRSRSGSRDERRRVRSRSRSRDGGRRDRLEANTRRHSPERRTGTQRSPSPSRRQSKRPASRSVERHDHRKDRQADLKTKKSKKSKRASSSDEESSASAQSESEDSESDSADSTSHSTSSSEADRHKKKKTKKSKKDHKSKSSKKKKSRKHKK